ncbi:general secretion pathway protein GspB [Sessilibacter corallicola]|uniref:general secretion pathway protein GspB n=1 Tax=Sessilibacter corallicola TaxID=2904075 RepID=UPI001E3506D3|nr:general secretion pathway protein GspB [Sessilibacter corallicola]MCE2026855.1 general secretion pathway protein GspB [Sessilibacter corallicola]
MSYILDALQKSEQERQQQQAVPTISAAHDAQFAQTNNKLPTAWWLVIILSILLIGLIGYLVFGNSNSTNTDVTPSAQTHSIQTTSNLAPSSSVGNAPEPAPQNNQSTDLKPSISNELQTVKTNESSDIGESTEVTSSNTLSQSKISELYRTAKETRTEQTTSNTPVNLETNNVTEVDLTKPAPPENIPVKKEPQQPLFPSIYELPDVIQSEIPPIQYIAHVYSSDVSKGFVILNNVKLTPGRRLQGDLYLEQVAQDHVVMSFKGYLFRVPSMTNWDGRY